MFKGLLGILKVVHAKKAACWWSVNENNLLKAIEKTLECETLAVYCALDEYIQYAQWGISSMSSCYHQ